MVGGGLGWWARVTGFEWWVRVRLRGFGWWVLLLPIKAQKRSD